MYIHLPEIGAAKRALSKRTQEGNQRDERTF